MEAAISEKLVAKTRFDTVGWVETEDGRGVMPDSIRRKGGKNHDSRAAARQKNETRTKISECAKGLERELRSVEIAIAGNDEVEVRLVNAVEALKEKREGVGSADREHKDWQARVRDVKECVREWRNLDARRTVLLRKFVYSTVIRAWDQRADHLENERARGEELKGQLLECQQEMQELRDAKSKELQDARGKVGSGEDERQERIESLERQLRVAKKTEQEAVQEAEEEAVAGTRLRAKVQRLEAELRETRDAMEDALLGPEARRLKDERNKYRRQEELAVAERESAEIQLHEMEWKAARALAEANRETERVTVNAARDAAIVARDWQQERDDQLEYQKQLQEQLTELQEKTQGGLDPTEGCGMCAKLSADLEALMEELINHDIKAEREQLELARRCQQMEGEHREMAAQLKIEMRAPRAWTPMGSPAGQPSPAGRGSLGTDGRPRGTMSPANGDDSEGGYWLVATGGGVDAVPAGVVLGADINGELVMAVYGTQDEYGSWEHGPVSDICREYAMLSRVLWAGDRAWVTATCPGVSPQELREFEQLANEGATQLRGGELTSPDTAHTAGPQAAEEAENWLRGCPVGQVLTIHLPGGICTTGTFRKRVRQVVVLRTMYLEANYQRHLISTAEQVLAWAQAGDAPSTGSRPAYGAWEQRTASNVSPGWGPLEARVPPMLSLPAPRMRTETQLPPPRGQVPGQWETPSRRNDGAADRAGGSPGRTTASGGTQRSASEAAILAEWMKEASKARVGMDADWSEEQLATPAVIARIQQVKEWLQGNIERDGQRMSEAAISQGVWQMLRINDVAARRVRPYIQLADNDDGIGYGGGITAADEWINAMFQTLTGKDYRCAGRARRLEHFRLPDSWVFDQATHLVGDWIGVKTQDRVPPTVEETLVMVKMLTEATGFAPVIEDAVAARARRAYSNSERAAPNDEKERSRLFWEEIAKLVVERLEGAHGVYESWNEYKDRTLNGE